MKELPSARAILAENLATYRKKRPTTFATPGRIAKAARIDQKTVDRAMKKENAATVDTLDAIATAFGVPTYALLMPGLDPDSLPIFPEEDEIEAEVNRRVLAKLEQIIPEAKRLVVRDEEQTRPDVTDPFLDRGHPEKKRAGESRAPSSPPQSQARPKAKRP